METNPIEDLDPSSDQTEEVRGGTRSNLNGNLQIADLTSVAIDPLPSGIGVGELQETTISK